MSVYTTVEHAELEAFLREYSLGQLVSYAGISAGIENTNYFVTTTQGEYVLTLFEELGAEELPYFLELTAHLAEHQVPCAHPEADNNHHYLRELKGKPAALVRRLHGDHISEANLQQCAAIGRAMAIMHREGESFGPVRHNPRGAVWWRQTARRVLPELDSDDKELLEEELRFQALHKLPDVPRGLIHADLFRDNALFAGDELTGIIDFYYACHDVWLLDIGITVNDWCSLEDGGLDEARTVAILEAYAHERPFTSLERGAWPVMLRAAALRFWLSRLQDLYFPKQGEITHTKDPAVFRRILANRVEQHEQLRHI